MRCGQGLFRRFHVSDHSLDNMVQLMDKERVQFHYDVQARAP